MNGRLASGNTDGASAAGTLVDIDFRGVSSESGSDAGHMRLDGDGGIGGSADRLPRIANGNGHSNGHRRVNSSPERRSGRHGSRDKKKQKKQPDHVDWTFIHPSFYM